MSDPSITAAYISGGFTVLAACLAFGPVAWQIWSQARQNRESSQQAQKQAFKQDLYRDGVAAARRLSNAAGSYMTRLYVAQTQIEISVSAREAGVNAPAPAVRYPEFLELGRALSDATTDLIFLIEERRIADTRFDIFRLAFLATAHDVRERFHGEFQSALMRALPHELPDGTLAPYEAPNQVALEAIKAWIGNLVEPLSDQTAFSEDLIVELQNSYLGDIFESQIEHRVPLDPSRKVLRLENFDELKAWVEQTPWGIMCKEADERFLANSDQD